MSNPVARGLAVRSLAALAGIVFVGALARPAAAQDARESRDARGSIREMERLSATEGWVLTDTALLFTRDGGVSWADMASGERLEGVTDAFFQGASHAWLAGVDSRAADRLVVLDSTNGGASWREQRVEASALASGRIYARAQVHFLDAAHGWLLGKVATSAAFSVAELLRTSDGGATWERLPRPPVGYMYEAWLTNTADSTKRFNLGPILAPYPDLTSLVDADISTNPPLSGAEIIQAAIRNVAPAATFYCDYDRVQVRLSPKNGNTAVLSPTIVLSGTNPRAGCP